jgi:hypothetical protein
MTSHYMRCTVRSTFETVFGFLSQDSATYTLGNSVRLRARSISYGVHSAFVHDVRNFLEKSGLEVIVEEEISYFDRTKNVNI